MTALRIAFAGTPEFAVPALQALLTSRHEVVGVLTQPDRPRGRGRRLAASAVKDAALAAGLALSQPATLKTEEARAAFAAWHAQVLVVVAYGLILPQAMLDLMRFGAVNIHASLLPRWRGAAPIQRALLAGDVETGVTLMQMDAGLDTGGILLQRRVSIGADETAARLHDRLAALGADALLETLERLASGSLAAVPQSSEGVTYAAKLAKSEAVIDWQLPAAIIDRQVRAFNPWPVAETIYDGEPLRVLAARLEGDASTSRGSAVGVPGTIVQVRDDAIDVQCGTGILSLTEVQRAGRRPVTARDFSHAQPLVGLTLGHGS